MDPEILFSASPTASERNVLLNLLVTYNEKKQGPSGYVDIAIFLRDPETGAILGGLSGACVYDWVVIELLFVPESMRGKGIGSKLLQMVEEWATEQGCVGVWLSTYNFQAPAFYEKNGYEQFGDVSDHPRGAKRAFFRRIIGQSRPQVRWSFFRKRVPQRGRPPGKHRAEARDIGVLRGP